MAAPFTIRDSLEGGTAHVYLSGELDLAAKETLRSFVETSLHDGAVSAVLIDLTDLTFIDSTGIGALIGCLRLADSSGKAVRAVGARGRVAGVLDLTGVTSMLAGTDSPEPDGAPSAAGRTA